MIKYYLWRFLARMQCRRNGPLTDAGSGAHFVLKYADNPKYLARKGHHNYLLDCLQAAVDSDIRVKLLDSLAQCHSADATVVNRLARLLWPQEGLVPAREKTAAEAAILQLAKKDADCFLGLVKYDPLQNNYPCDEVDLNVKIRACWPNWFLADTVGHALHQIVAGKTSRTLKLRAIPLLGRRAAVDDLPVLKELCGSPDQAIREAVYPALGHFSVDAVFDQLVSGLEDPVPEVIQSASAAMGTLGSLRAIPILLAKLETEWGDLRVRSAMMKAVADIGGDALQGEIYQGLLEAGLLDVERWSAFRHDTSGVYNRIFWESCLKHHAPRGQELTKKLTLAFAAESA
ncbi:HEAT repeat domain-containing protein [bacterium]|nr:HEAT repeat domain-containing protein [bacterium]